MPRCGTGGWVVTMHRVGIFYASEMLLESHLRGLLDCDVCAVGKAQQLAHPKIANQKVRRPFQLFYGSLVGPFRPVAIGDYKYFSKITDKYTKWTALYLLTRKNQALQLLQLFVGSTAILFGSHIVRWRADKSGEYTGEEVRQYCLETGIIQEFAATNTPQQIGVSKREGRTLCAMVRYMLANSDFPSSIWRELFMAAYLKNRTPQKAQKMETPFKMLLGEEADLSPIHVIEARTFVYTKDFRKLDAAAWGGKVCGYSKES